MKVLSIVGARPQFIKEAALQQKLKDFGIEETLLNTGQHYDHNMAGQFFEDLSIKAPNITLDIQHDLDPVVRLTRMTAAIGGHLSEGNYDMVIVYGDTDTTLAGALAASKSGVPVAHVEAGLRQLPEDMPEEINRRMVDSISTLLFTPSPVATENLRNENKRGVYFSGDIMYDVWTAAQGRFKEEVLNWLSLKSNGYAVATIHRSFNVDDAGTLEQIIHQLRSLSTLIPVVFPIHPRTRARIKEFSLEGLLDFHRLIITDPLDYFSLQSLVKFSRVVVTDSGGLQKEAYWHGRRGIVVMGDTCWWELINLGWNVLTEPDGILKTYIDLKDIGYPEIAYGVDSAAYRIANIISGFNLKERKTRRDDPSMMLLTDDDLINHIKRQVAHRVGIPIHEIDNCTRRRNVVTARQLTQTFTRQMTKLSLSQIGEKIGSKDHSTVLHAIRTVSNLYDTDREYRSMVNSLEDILYTQLKFSELMPQAHE